MLKSNFNSPKAESKFFTAEFPGVGGKIKIKAEDFVVEEILIDPPLGEGNHFYLFFEKVGINTVDLVRILAKIFNISEWGVGYAGRKDSNSYSRQWFSVSCSHKEFLNKKTELENLKNKNCVFLCFKKGLKKLRRGALKSNKFQIRIRDVSPFALERSREIIEYLASNKLPNYFGPQRFGVHGNVANIVRFLLSKDYNLAISSLVGEKRLETVKNFEKTRLNEAIRKFEKSDFVGAKELWPNSWIAERRVLTSLAKGSSNEKAIKALPFLERNFFGSAFQSQLFNECLSLRLELGYFDSLFEGDVALSNNFSRPQLMRNSEETEKNRTDLSVSPSGPIYGKRMLKPFGTELEIETAVLLKYDLCLDNFISNLTDLRLKGGRRAYRADILDFEVWSTDKDLFLKLELSKGAFATQVLKEVMKV